MDMDMVNRNGKRSRDDGESENESKRSRSDHDPLSPQEDSQEALDFSRTGSSNAPTPKSDVCLKEEEKENFNNEDDNAPMDLSKKPSSPDVKVDLSKKPSSPPDVIMLSDSDDESGGKMNGDIPHVNGEWTSEKKHIVKSFKEELRNEEAKLVLLKKLRHSQRTHQLQETNSNKAHSGSRPPNSAPPPLVRGSGPTPNSHSSNTPSTKPQNSIMSRTPTSAHSQPMRQQAHQQPPPLVMNQGMRSHGHSSPSSQNMRSGMNSSPNMLPGYRSSMSQSQQQGQSSAPPQQNQPQPQIDTQTPAQRQAAAKLALRKQLEKTLLQIPPPKPPPPEMNFIPSLASNEFILLVGLEEVVKTITDLDAAAKGQKTQDVKYVFNPFTCVQCGTDFTPVWKRDKPGSKNVICETCVTSNQKKALKQEHTNRLKSAFVKALQQEQEIEQRMQSQPTTTAPSPQPAPSNPVNLTGSSYKHSQAQLTHHNLMQAHQAQMRNNPQAAVAAAAALGIPGFNARMPFAFPYTKQSDIQRQYLLDMIPSRNLPPGAMPWGKN